MPQGQFRGMTKKTTVPKVKGRIREPRAKRAWSGSRKFGKDRYFLEGVQPKKPTKTQLKSIRTTKNARVVKSGPKEGHRFIVRTGKVVGKYAVYSKPKKSNPTRKKPGRKRKPGPKKGSTKKKSMRNKKGSGFRKSRRKK